MQSERLDLEDRIARLSLQDRLLLIERVARDLRRDLVRDDPGVDEQLTAMASDPDIQRELRLIAAEEEGPAGSPDREAA